jgi:hypothetical protein
MVALLIAQILRGDGRRAQMTFFMGILAVLLQHLGCVFAGDIGGWTAFVILILLIVLIGMIHGGVFSSEPSIMPDKCIPIPSGPPAPSAPMCAPACPLCPGEEECPIPDYLPY